MSCLCWCWKKARPRYKQLVQALFPDEDSVDHDKKHAVAAPHTPRASGHLPPGGMASPPPLGGSSDAKHGPADSGAAAAAGAGSGGSGHPHSLGALGPSASSRHLHSQHGAAAAAGSGRHLGGGGAGGAPHHRPPHVKADGGLIGLGEDNEYGPQNVSDLIEYAASFPAKLASIGKYMFKLVKENLKKHKNKCVFPVPSLPLSPV
jgi:hypothetical protein